MLKKVGDGVVNYYFVKNGIYVKILIILHILNMKEKIYLEIL